MSRTSAAAASKLKRSRAARMATRDDFFEDENPPDEDGSSQS